MTFAVTMALLGCLGLCRSRFGIPAGRNVPSLDLFGLWFAGRRQSAHSTLPCGANDSFPALFVSAFAFSARLCSVDAPHALRKAWLRSSRPGWLPQGPKIWFAVQATERIFWAGRPSRCDGSALAPISSWHRSSTHPRRIGSATLRRSFTWPTCA